MLDFSHNLAKSSTTTRRGLSCTLSERTILPFSGDEIWFYIVGTFFFSYLEKKEKL